MTKQEKAELAELRERVAFLEEHASFTAKEKMRLKKSAAEQARFREMQPDDVRVAPDIDVRKWFACVGADRALDFLGALPEADQMRIAGIIDGETGITRRKLHLRSGGAIPKYVRLTANVTRLGRKPIEITRDVVKALGADGVGNVKGISSTREELVPSVGFDGRTRERLHHVNTYGGGRSAVELLREAGVPCTFSGSGTNGVWFVQPWDVYDDSSKWTPVTNRIIREDLLQRVLVVDGQLRQMLVDGEIKIEPMGHEYDANVYLNERGPVDSNYWVVPASGAW